MKQAKNSLNYDSNDLIDSADFKNQSNHDNHKNQGSDNRKGWEIKKLKEIGIAQTGTTPKTSEKENFGDFIPFIKPADVDFSGSGDIRYDNDGLSEIGLKNGRKMERGSTLMVCIGATIGKVGFTEKDVSCNQQINSLTVKKDFNPKFIYYAMTSKNFQDKVLLEGKGAQATLPIINKSKWENLTIPYPVSLPEQQRIVAILDEAFAAIAKAKANAQQNLQNAKELFESYLQGVFENKGEKLTEENMEDVCSILTCGVASTPKYVDEKEGVPFLSAQNVRDGQVVLDKYRFISKSFHQDLTKKNKPAKGDILYSRVGSKFGEAGVVEHEFEFSVYVSVTLIRTIPEKVNNFYLKFYLNSPLIKDLAKKCISSSGVPNLNVNEVRKFPVKYPILKRQLEIIRHIETLNAETKKLESIYQQKINDLEELKKSVLQKAFSGELKTVRGEV